MGGRYLLIEFDDEASASRLRAQIDSATLKGRPFRVVGLFAKPGPRFCRCGTWTTSRGQVSTLKFGAKFGWQVCTTCKRPAPIISFLRNLLKPEDVIQPQTHDTLDGKMKLQFFPLGLSAPTRRV